MYPDFLIINIKQKMKEDVHPFLALMVGFVISQHYAELEHIHIQQV